ncbi:MAG: cation:proton antiporter [Cyanobacteria bacterium]|nr:cation:proton antiporter [Cyanobacteriota bacterium]
MAADPQARLALIWGVSFFSGSLAQLAARLSGLPGVVLLLATGLLLGHAGLDWVQPDQLGRGLEPLVGLLVSLVLFDGGLNLRLAGRDLQRSVLQLVVVRSVLGLAGGAALAHWVAGLPWSLSLVFGAIALATGPTVVNPLVRQMRLSPFLARVLEAEGLILEPVSAVLALLLLQLALGDLGGWQDVAWRLLLRVGVGVGLGALAGLALALVLERLQPAEADGGAGSSETASGGLSLQLTLGTLFLLFSGCEALLPESGLPAAVSAGVVVGLRLDNAASELDALIAQLAMLAITVLFPLLAADVSWAELSPLGLGGVACVLGLMVLRLLVVMSAGVGLPLNVREKLLVSWIAPRGIVTAAVASLFALQLSEAGVAAAGALKGLVFLTILITVGLGGVTAPWLATKLGLSGAEEAGTDEDPAISASAAGTVPSGNA